MHLQFVAERCKLHSFQSEYAARHSCTLENQCLQLETPSYKLPAITYAIRIQTKNIRIFELVQIFDYTELISSAITGVFVIIAFHGVGGRLFLLLSKNPAVFDFKNNFSLSLINGWLSGFS